jgi:hypothetical protein
MELSLALTNNQARMNNHGWIYMAAMDGSSSYTTSCNSIIIAADDPEWQNAATAAPLLGMY